MLCLALPAMGKRSHGEHHLCVEIKSFQEVLGGSLVGRRLVLYQSHQGWQLILPFLVHSLHCLCEPGCKWGSWLWRAGKFYSYLHFPPFLVPPRIQNHCKRKVWETLSVTRRVSELPPLQTGCFDFHWNNRWYGHTKWKSLRGVICLFPLHGV